jgi:GTP pyrophosphokinase
MLKHEMVITAYCVAARTHRNQLRKNGEPVLTHCLEVAKVLASMGLDPETIATGLVHEVVSAGQDSADKASISCTSSSTACQA